MEECDPPLKSSPNAQTVLNLQPEEEEGLQPHSSSAGCSQHWTASVHSAEQHTAKSHIFAQFSYYKNVECMNVQ